MCGVMFSHSLHLTHHSNQIRKSFFHTAETGYAQPEEENDDSEAEHEAGYVNGAFTAEDAPAETVDYSHHSE